MPRDDAIRASELLKKLKDRPYVSFADFWFVDSKKIEENQPKVLVQT